MSELGNLDDLADVDAGTFGLIIRPGEQQEESIRFIDRLAALARASTTRGCLGRLNVRIKALDDALDHDQEVAVRLTSTGQSVTFHVERLGFDDLSLIVFYGQTLEGSRVGSAQNITQINFVLIALEKPRPKGPRRPFGFGQAMAAQAAVEV